MTGDLELISERDDEVPLFCVLPDEYTTGTSYEYYRNFPHLDEEVYYLLECATRQNADPEEVIEKCKQVQRERNEMLLSCFNNTLDLTS